MQPEFSSLGIPAKPFHAASAKVVGGLNQEVPSLLSSCPQPLASIGASRVPTGEEKLANPTGDPNQQEERQQVWPEAQEEKQQ